MPPPVLVSAKSTVEALAVDVPDWARALIALDRQALDAAAVEQTLGVVLKAKDDIDAVRGERLASILSRVGGG